VIPMVPSWFKYWR